MRSAPPPRDRASQRPARRSAPALRPRGCAATASEAGVVISDRLAGAVPCLELGKFPRAKSAPNRRRFTFNGGPTCRHRRSIQGRAVAPVHRVASELCGWPGAVSLSRDSTEPDETESHAGLHSWHLAFWPNSFSRAAFPVEKIERWSRNA
jgi:hypothetical protein